MRYKPKTKPFVHQRKGLIWLWGKKGRGGLFWHPGTGKTKAVIDYVGANSKINRVLVLCPINALGVWPAQIRRHLPLNIPRLVIEPTGTVAQKARQVLELEDSEGEVSWLILNYDAVSKRDKDWALMTALEAWSPQLLVLDESHKIKNPTALRSKAALRLAERAPYVIAMTGTPIGKNLLDLYSQLKAINPKTWLEDDKVMTWTRFRENYAVFGGRSGYELKRYINIPDLERRYIPHVSVVRKQDCFDLPDVTHAVVHVPLLGSQKLAYKVFSKDGMVVWRRHLIEAPIVLTKLMRLQEMTGGWVHDENGEVVEFQTEKLKYLLDKLEELKDAGQRVVIFARFVAELEAIQRATGSPYLVRGGVSDRERRRHIAEFRLEKAGRPFIIQVDSAEALDGLQEASSYGIFYSTGYSLISYNQAIGRLARTGQSEPVVFYHLHVPGTVDALTYRALRQKRDLERLVMDNPDLLISGA